MSSSNAWKWKVKVKSLSRVRLVATPWTAAYQAPPSMGFSRQEYWSGLPLPSPEKCYRWSYLQRRNRNTDIESNVWVPRASLVVQMVKNLPAMQETWVRSLENPLDKGMAIHPSTLDWRISWTEEPGGLPSMGSQTVGWIERLTLSFSRGERRAEGIGRLGLTYIHYWHYV